MPDRPQTTPSIPTTVRSIMGPVGVSMIEEVGDDNNCGDWSHEKREIRIRESLPDAVIWHTLYHEKMHMILEDSGVAQMLTKKLEEAICDAYATYSVATRTP